MSTDLPSSRPSQIRETEEMNRSGAEITPPPARLFPVLWEGIRVAWDRLGLVIAVSVTWTLLLFLPLWVGAILPSSVPLLARYGTMLLTLALVGSVPTAGAFAVAQRVAAHREVTYSDFWREGTALFGPALRLILIHQAALGLFAVNFGFYLMLGNVIGKIVCILCLYALALFLMMAVYQWPLLIAQETGVFDEPGRRAKRGAFAALRRSFFLAMGRPFYSLGLLAALLLVSALLFATLALPALLWIGVLAMLATFATRGLLIQYGVLPAPIQEKPVPDEKFRLK